MSVAIVLSDEPGSSERISEFADSTDQWMVAVRMVSEGVDVPRLAVGGYATSAATPLFFAQAIGRFVRSRRPGETASVFLPSVPVLLNLAEHMEKQRDHVLGKPDRPKQGWEDDLLAEANREQNEPDDAGSYESLGADAELDSLIYDGSTYGTGTFSGSEEEAEYLGLPGLLDADQVKALLRKRQEEQLDARDEQERLRREREAEEAKLKEIEGTSFRGKTAAAVDEDEAASEEIPRLRKELNTIVSIVAGKRKRPHGAIHTEARKACGGPPTALCTAEQLRDRIAYLRDW